MKFILKLRWCKGEPNNDGKGQNEIKEGCAQLAVGGCFNDSPCSSTFWFLCEKQANKTPF